MAHRSVLIVAMKFLGILSLVAVVGVQFFSGTGCAITHRYPSYRGQVIELGTDKPIDGAGVLALYETQIASVGGWAKRYLGYQAVLSDRQGKFEVPRKWFFTFRPFSRFVEQPYITIYKKGYGNFPGSLPEIPPSQGGKIEPKVVPLPMLPAETDVKIWLPAMRTEEEQEYHDRNMMRFPLGNSFPPPGMTEEQFGPPGR